MPGFILALGILGFGVGLHSLAPSPADREPVPLPSATRAAPGGPGKGRFLVARRSLVDPNFSQTVVLLIEYGDQGAMGLIVNRPTEVKLSEVLEIEGAERLLEPVYSGGPVAHGRMLMLLRAQEAPEGALPVFRDVHSSGSRELLDQLVAQPGSVKQFRVYAGHAGWAPGQLEAEIDRGGWHVMPGDPELVFSSAPKSVWRELIRRAVTRWTRRKEGPAGGVATRSARGGRGTDVSRSVGIGSEPGSLRSVTLP